MVHLDKVEARLIRQREQLGLSPEALGTLLRNAAGVAATRNDRAGLEAMRAEGSRILAARSSATTVDDLEALASQHEPAAKRRPAISTPPPPAAFRPSDGSADA